MTRLPLILACAVLLTGAQCSKAEIDSKIAALTGTPQPFMALTEEPPMVETVGFVEPRPVYERVCWIEWHRAGTMAVEVCEDRLVTP